MPPSKFEVIACENASSASRFGESGTGNVSRKRWLNEVENAAIPSSRVAAAKPLTLVNAVINQCDTYCSISSVHFGFHKICQTGTFRQRTSGTRGGYLLRVFRQRAEGRRTGQDANPTP